MLFSDNVTDRMRGSADRLREMGERLWVEPGKVSEDGLVSLGRTSSIGLCDHAPALLVNGLPVPDVDARRASELCDLILARVPLAEWPRELFVVEDFVRRRDVMLSDPIRPGDAIRAAIERGEASGTGPQATLEEIKSARLLGRGGAGFTTGVKWESCSRQPVTPRVVVCNADEGEPGTFKDRLLLRQHADLIFEGMTVAAYGIGATQGFVYLRGEYRYLLDALRDTLERRRQAGLLGKAICGRAGLRLRRRDPRRGGLLRVRRGIRAGRVARGQARHPAQPAAAAGREGLPRAADRREQRRELLRGGADPAAWRGLVPQPRHARARRAPSCCRSRATASGPASTSTRSASACAEVLRGCGRPRHDRRAGRAALPASASARTSSTRRIGFEDIETGGAFMVFDDSRDMFEVARHFAHFFAHESCGFCTPCRVGTSLLRNLMDRIRDGKGSQHDLVAIEELGGLLRGASHCGLGESASRPLLGTLQRFRPAYERRLESSAVEPAFDLDGALARARRMTGRDDEGAHIGEAP